MGVGHILMYDLFQTEVSGVGAKSGECKRALVLTAILLFLMEGSAVFYKLT